MKLLMAMPRRGWQSREIVTMDILMASGGAQSGIYGPDSFVPREKFLRPFVATGDYADALS